MRFIAYAKPMPVSGSANPNEPPVPIVPNALPLRVLPIGNADGELDVQGCFDTRCRTQRVFLTHGVSLSGVPGERSVSDDVRPIGRCLGRP